VSILSPAAKYTESPKHALERAHGSEAGLQKIQADERREQKPSRMNQPAKRERSENERTGKAANDVVIAHV
jgi:hypothetical protein